MAWHVTLPTESYEAARDGFEWDIPSGYNAAHDLVGKHEDQARVALFQAYPDGRRETYSFAELDRYSDRLASALAAYGVGRGDRVGVVLPQVPANPLTHLACWKLGAVSMPLSVLFGPDALGYRLRDSGASTVVVDADRYGTVEDVWDDCPALEHVVEVDWREAGGHEEPDAFADLLADTPADVDSVETDPETPAVIMYTSGSTGPPKGVLHTHSVWLGHCPAFRMYFELDVSEAVCWTPADWAWIGALGDLVFPAWHYGRPIVGYPQRGFDPERSFEILEEFDVTHAMFVPTALRMLMAAEVEPGDYDLALETLMSGSESVTPEITAWVADAFGDVPINENYGQTEVTGPISSCAAWFEPRPGSMGKPVPGSDVAVIDSETGERKPPGEIGEIAVRRNPAHPGIFEEYWNDPERTAAARIEGWHLTGDLATVDDDGYIWFESRADDLIITSGYRVSPIDVEKAILEHDAVTQAGVIGIPDDRRGEVIKAFVETTGDEAAAIADELEHLVRGRVAQYAYPREVEVVDDLPKTVTGKIKRTTLRDREQADQAE